MSEIGNQIPESDPGPKPPSAPEKAHKGFWGLLLDVLVQRDSVSLAALGIYLTSRTPKTVREHPWRWSAAALFLLWLFDLSLQFRSPPPELGRGFVHLAHKALATYRGQSEWCEDQARGRFEQDSSDFRDVGWILELDRYGQWGPADGWSSTSFRNEGGALLISRPEPPKGTPEQFLFPPSAQFPFASDYPRIQFAIPDSWHSKKIVLNLSTKWDKVVPFGNGYPAVIAVSYRYSIPWLFAGARSSEMVGPSITAQSGGGIATGGSTSRSTTSMGTRKVLGHLGRRTASPVLVERFAQAERSEPGSIGTQRAASRLRSRTLPMATAGRTTTHRAGRGRQAKLYRLARSVLGPTGKLQER